MFKQTSLIILSMIPTQKEHQIFYFTGDYSVVAKEYYETKETRFDPNDFMYKLIYKEYQESNQHESE
jgi:hypothetical protein